MTKPEFSADEREEIDTLLSEALNGSRSTDAASIGRFLAAVAAAERAGRVWPQVLRDLALWEWTHTAQKSIAKRESVVFFDHAGRTVGKATRVGKRVRRDDGAQGFQQALIADMTWDELSAWGDLIRAQIDGLAPNLSIVQRLQGLHQRMPNTHGPGEACELLGTTVEEFLAEAAS